MITKFLRTVFLVDLLQGLWVTFRNQDPKRIYTEQYPAERPKVGERYRGAPRRCSCRGPLPPEPEPVGSLPRRLSGEIEPDSHAPRAAMTERT